MLVRLASVAVVAVLALTPRVALADCAEQISKLMSKDTEKLTTRYNKVAKLAREKGGNAKAVQEECRLARQLLPALEGQLTALKQSGCAKDPQMGNMIADIVRGHETDLAMAVKTINRPDCH